MMLPGWVQVRAGESTGKGKMLRWPRTWLGEAVCLWDRTFFQFRFADSHFRGRPKTKGSLCEGQCLFYTASWALLPVWLSEGCLSVLMKSI